MTLLGWIFAAIAFVLAIMMRRISNRNVRENVLLSDYVAILLLDDDMRKNHSMDFKRFVSQNIFDTTTPSVYRVNQAARNIAINLVNDSGGPGAASSAFVQIFLDSKDQQMRIAKL